MRDTEFNWDDDKGDGPMSDQNWQTFRYLAAGLDPNQNQAPTITFPPRETREWDTIVTKLEQMLAMAKYARDVARARTHRAR